MKLKWSIGISGLFHLLVHKKIVNGFAIIAHVLVDIEVELGMKRMISPSRLVQITSLIYASSSYTLCCRCRCWGCRCWPDWLRTGRVEQPRVEDGDAGVNAIRFRRASISLGQDANNGRNVVLDLNHRGALVVLAGRSNRT